MWWCQPRQVRTSWWAIPSSPFASSNATSMGHRAPLTRARSARGQAAPALDQEVLVEQPPVRGLGRSIRLNGFS